MNLAIVAAGAFGLLTTTGLTPTDKEVQRTAGQVGLEKDALRGLGLDAQLLPWWAVQARMAPCAGLPGATLDEAVATSDAYLADLEATAAVSTLRDAIEATPCAADWVDEGALKVALEWWGHAGQLAGDERVARTAYAQLSAVDPGWRIRPPPGSGFEGLWDTVRGELAARPFTTLALHVGARQVRWNGSPLSGPTARVDAAPGRHLLQWLDGAGQVQGAWVAIPGTSPRAALITSERHEAVALLAEGMGTEAGRLALEVWLGALATAHGLDGLVVLDPGAKPPSGYRLDSEGLRPWAGSAAATFTMQPDRMRVLVGAGWLGVQEFGFHYADVRLGLDVKIIGPLHFTADVDLGLASISHPRSAEWDGGVVLLPGVGLGVAIRRPTGLVQPFGAVTGGVWSAPGFEDVDSTLDGALLDDSSRVHTAELPVTPRLFVDGGVDLVPGGQNLVIRVAGGVGYGLGFQSRVGVLVGGRFGR